MILKSSLIYLFHCNGMVVRAFLSFSVMSSDIVNCVMTQDKLFLFHLLVPLLMS